MPRFFFSLSTEWIDKLCPWWPFNAGLTLVHILVNHSFSIFNTISFFNPYALLYSHVVKVQRSKLFITSTSWMFRPISACKHSQPWSEVNEHVQDEILANTDMLVLEESVNESKHFDLMKRRLQTEYWNNEVIISIGLFYSSLRETDRSRSTKNDKLNVSKAFSECFQSFWSWKTSKLKLKTRRVEV